MIRFFVNRKKTVLFVWGLMVVGFLFAITARILSGGTVIDNSVGVWFLEDDPERANLERYNQDFGEKEWSILLLRTDSIYEPRFLNDLRNIVSRLEKLDHIVKVTSIVNVRDNELDQDEALDYKIIYPAKWAPGRTLAASELAKFKDKLFANPLFDRNIFQKDAPQFTVVLLQNDNYINNPSPYRIELVDAIKTIVGEYPTVKGYALAGTTIVNAELNRSAKRDVFVFYTLISILLLLFGWFTLNNFKDVTVMLAVVIASVIPTMGLLAVLDIPYNMVTVMMPTILIALSVAGVIHVINVFHQYCETRHSSRAIEQAISHLWKPNLWTALTTIVGFSSLALSTVLPVFQLGVFASIGIFIGWLATNSLAPVLLMIFWGGKSKGRANNPVVIDAVVNFVVAISSRQPLLKIGIALLTLIPVWGVAYLETDTNYTKFFRESAQLSKAYNEIDAAGYAQNPVNIVLRYPGGHTYSNQAFFQNVVRFEQGLKQLPEVIKVLSTTELLRRIDIAFNDEETSEQQFRAYGANQINQLLLLGELSNNDDIEDFLLRDKTQAQIVALTSYMSTKELATFENKVQRLRQQYLPDDLELVITGTTVLWANMDSQVSRTQLVSLVGVGTFLVVFLIVIFKSLRLGVIGIIVNALPLAITLGVMGWLGVKINMATAIIGGISLGVVVDDTIHFITRFKNGLRNGLDFEESVKETLKTVGTSIIATSIILIGGFSCMASSDFLPSAHFGIFISLSIAIALLLDLFLLPALLSLYRPSKTRAGKKFFSLRSRIETAKYQPGKYWSGRE